MGRRRHRSTAMARPATAFGVLTAGLVTRIPELTGQSRLAPSARSPASSTRDRRGAACCRVLASAVLCWDLRAGLRWLVVLVALVATLGVSRSAHADLRIERSDGADSCPDTASFA